MPKIPDKDILRCYYDDIKNNKALKASEEHEMARLIKKGDRKALERLIKANLKFVVSVAIGYSRQGMPLIDLINEGNIGLMKAAMRFDPSKNFKFISYAVWWIRQSILQALAEQSRVVRVPLNQVAKIRETRKAQEKEEQIQKRPVTQEEIEGRMSIESYSDMNDTLRLDSIPVRIDNPDIKELSSLLSNDTIDNTDRFIESYSISEEVKKYLDHLTDKEKKILMDYFGINEDNYCLTLSEIGDSFNLTRERIRQIRDLALIKLRKVYKTEKAL